MSMPVIETENLQIGYHQKAIVSHINLSIQQGEFIGLLGSNGSGKSTFLRALLGLIKPLSGKIQVLGHTPYRGNKQIGYMPQIRHPQNIVNLSSIALLEAAFSGTCYGIPYVSRSNKDYIRHILESVAAESYAERPFNQLSGGERQRIFLAQALLDEPQLLLLDEPLANLDPHYQAEFVSLLNRIQKQSSVTILLSEHDPNPLLTSMTRVLYFARKKAVIGTVDNVITSETLSTLYETPIEVLRLKDRLFVLGGGTSHHTQDNHYV